ncbi:MAG: TatD family hydrolase [Patescibacteria group bacterium]
MQFFDTHSHVNFKDFKDDADEVIRRSLDNNTWMVLVGAEYKTSNRALTYANKYESGVYAAVGLHPTHLEEVIAHSSDEKGATQYLTRGEDFNYATYEKLAKFEKVVAIGEIGLDYYHFDLSGDITAIKKKQKKILLEQLELARSLDLPVIIHCRQAHADLLPLLQDFRKENRHLMSQDKPWGVIHCYSGDENLAWEYFKLGLMISFTGLITFSQMWDDLIRKIPLEKIMIETDCPYMTPEPYRGQRNEPLLVQYVAGRIAEIKGLKLERVAEVTTNNAKRFFGI